MSILNDDHLCLSGDDDPADTRLSESMRKVYDNVQWPFLDTNLSSLDRSLTASGHIQGFERGFSSLKPHYTLLIYRDEGNTRLTAYPLPQLSSEVSMDDPEPSLNEQAVPSVLPELDSDSNTAESDEESVGAESPVDMTSSPCTDASAAGFHAMQSGLALHWGPVTNTLIKNAIRSAIPAVESLEKVRVVLYEVSEALNTQFTVFRTVEQEYQLQDDDWVLV